MNKFHTTRNRALNDRVTSSSSGWFSTRFSMSFVSCSQLSADNLLCRLGGSDLLDLVYFRFFWKWNQLELRHLCISVLPVNYCFLLWSCYIRQYLFTTNMTWAKMCWKTYMKQSSAVIIFLHYCIPKDA